MQPERTQVEEWYFDWNPGNDETLLHVKLAGCIYSSIRRYDLQAYECIQTKLEASLSCSKTTALPELYTWNVYTHANCFKGAQKWQNNNKTGGGTLSKQKKSDTEIKRLPKRKSASPTAAHLQDKKLLARKQANSSERVKLKSENLHFNLCMQRSL